MEDVIRQLREQVAELSRRGVELEARVAELGRQLAERDARIAELEAENERVRRKGYKPQPNRQASPQAKKPDRRTTEFRQHPGVFREPPRLDEIPPGQVERQDVWLHQCPCLRERAARRHGSGGGARRGRHSRAPARISLLPPPRV